MNLYYQVFYTFFCCTKVTKYLTSNLLPHNQCWLCCICTLCLFTVSKHILYSLPRVHSLYTLASYYLFISIIVSQKCKLVYKQHSLHRIQLLYGLHSHCITSLYNEIFLCCHLINKAMWDMSQLLLQSIVPPH